MAKIQKKNKKKQTLPTSFLFGDGQDLKSQTNKKTFIWLKKNQHI